MTRAAFIVGAPGALAIEVARQLRAAGLEIDLLCSAATQAGLDELRHEPGPTVRLHIGSSESIDFGLSGAAYLALAERIALAVCLEVPLPPGAKEATARSAARELIELALVSPRLEHLLFLSHVDVCGDASGTFGEHDLEAAGPSLGMGQEDRQGAERILRRFFRDLPITVLRSGWIVGTQPGLCPLAHLLLALDTWEELGTSAASLELLATPLEDLSRIAAGLVLARPPSSGRTLHAVGEGLPPLPELHALTARLAAAVVPAGFDRGAGARRAIKRDPHKKEWFVQEFFRHQPKRVRITTAYSRGVFAQLGLASPGFTESWLEALVQAAGEEIVGFK